MKISKISRKPNKSSSLKSRRVSTKAREAVKKRKSSNGDELNQLKLKELKELKPKTNVRDFRIVGIGASAGGLESFTQLLNLMPNNSGLAFIFIQHLDPTHPSLSTEILGRITQMPVTEARDRARVRPNHVYTLPPNYDLKIKNGCLKLLARNNRVPHKTIDSFFQSLALDRGMLAVGVVLSGTATDGTEGLRAIKAEGGITFAQLPKSAKYEGMPQAAIEAGVVDFILPPPEVAKELVRIAGQSNQALPQTALSESESRDENSTAIGDPLAQIISLLQSQMNFDFSEYKKTTLSRRIARRMIILRQPTEKDYANFLRSHKEEVETLFSEIFIHVTHFFRDSKAFDELKNKVFPQIIKNRGHQTPLRVWVPGCSSGEEAYSIAILLLDYLGKKASGLRLQIFASDISETAIQKARQGVYSIASLQGLPSQLVQRFFTSTDGGYRVNKSVRELCLFSKHDLISDPPFAKVDLISCRNLLIYFTSALQKRVIPLFHYALNPPGFLFLGHSETIGGFGNLFVAIDKNHRIYQKKPGVPLTRVQFSAPKKINQYEAIAKKRSDITKKRSDITVDFDSQKEADRIIALKYRPSGVVIDDDFEILHFRGRTVPYLEQPTGLASHSLLKMAHPELAGELRRILQAVKGQAHAVSVRKDGIYFEHDGQVEELSIEVVPLNPSFPRSQRRYLILFENFPVSKNRRDFKDSFEPMPEQSKKIVEGSQPAQRIKHLEQQLHSSREYQQVLTEDHEVAQEEVTTANEELQSTNEELQSTNEELETAKEELQSTNEELTTVNDELKNRNSELGTLSNDLINLLGSIEIPVVIVDSDHRIRRFTPSAHRLLNLIPTDIGRPMRDIRSNLNIEDLDSLISEVIATLKIKEIEVQDHKGLWYRLQIRPYRTTDNKIDGAVMTFVDIEAFKLTIGDLKGALDYATSIADALQIPSLILDRSLRVKSVNRLFCKVFDLSAASVEGQFLSELGSNNWSISQLESRLKHTILQQKPFQDFEVSSNFPSIGPKTFLLSARQIQWTDLAAPESILLSFIDITERKQIELALQESEEKYRALLESAHDAIIATDEKGLILVMNDQTENWFGYKRAEIIGSPIENLLPSCLRQSHIHLRQHFASSSPLIPLPEQPDLNGQRKDGSVFPIEVTLSPVKTSKGLLFIELIRDVTWRKDYEKERDIMFTREQKSRVEAERANLTKDIFLATLSHELRTPLSSILTWAQLIHTGKVDLEKAKQGAFVIEQSVKAQSQLIDDLLDVSRIIAGKLVLNIKQVDPNTVIQAAIESVGPMAEKKSLQIEFNRNAQPEEAERILADPVRLQQIIWNLLTNAIKFSPPGQKIEIYLNRIDNPLKRLLEIRVVDHGKGIPPDFLPYIFDRFSQADSSSTRTHGGLGLGLSIVRNLIELQGGSVRAANEPEGGAVFIVTFSLIAAHAAIVQTESPQSTDLLSHSDGDGRAHLSLDGMRILIVDDDQSTRESLMIYLRSFGANVVAAESAAIAMEKLRAFNPSVLVSDIAMPGEDGYSLLRKVRCLSEHANIAALALTANASQKDSELAISAGFQAHIAKPVEAHELVRIILEVHGGRTMSQSST